MKFCTYFFISQNAEKKIEWEIHLTGTPTSKKSFATNEKSSQNAMFFEKNCNQFCGKLCQFSWFIGFVISDGFIFNFPRGKRVLI